MNPFNYHRPTTVGEAVRLGSRSGARYIAGGTNLVDLMKENVERPAQLIDISKLPLGTIEEVDGALRLGALVPNADTAYDERVAARYPLLSSAIRHALSSGRPDWSRQRYTARRSWTRGAPLRPPKWAGGN